MYCFFIVPHVDIELEDNKQFISNIPRIYSEGQRPSGGSSILVHSSCPQREIKLVTNLQAVAVSVTLDKEITICSVYIPPNFHLETEHLDTLLKQLPSPYILVGDFNGHNILWGC